MSKEHRICTMPDGNWFVSSLHTEIEESAKESGGTIDGYDLAEMLELFGVGADENTHDPHNDLLKAIEASTSHTQMLESIRNSVTP